MLSVNDIKKYHSASLITTAEKSDMEVYKELQNNVTGAYFTNINFCSADKILVFRVYMEVNQFI